MADVPVLEIPVDTQEFDTFLDKYQKYQDKLADSGTSWDAINEKIETLRTEFEDAAKNFGGMVADSKNNNINQFFIVSAKASNETAKSWEKISKDVEKTSKWMTSLKQMGISLGAFGKDLFKGTLGLGAAYVGATVAAARNLAASNLDARSLGLQMGQPEAFENDFARFGLGKSDLGHMADIKADRNQWTPLQGLHITPDIIQKDDPEELLVEFEKRASKQYSDWQKQGLAAADMAKAYNFTDVLSLQQLRAGASYQDSNPQAFDQQQDAYQQDWPKLGANQATGDKATDFENSVKNDWQSVWKTFNEQLVNNSYELKNLSAAAAGAVTELLRIAGPEVKGVLDAIEGPPHVKNTPYAPGLAGALQQSGDILRDRVGGGLEYFGNTLWGTIDPTRPGLRRNMMDNPPPLDPRYATSNSGNTFSLPAASVNSNPWTEQALPVIADIEDASHDPRAVNPVTGAAGQYQLMPKTAKEFGVDAFDPIASRDVAGKLLNQYLDEFQNKAMALAAYDGDTHIAKDVEKYGGDWLQGAKKETLNYLNKAMQAGLNLDLSKTEKAFIADSLRKTVQPIPRPAANNTNDSNSDAPLFTLPQKSNQQTLPTMNVNITNSTSANVFTSLGGLTQ